ncbi:MAG: hypothetical protein HQ559_10790 [Lentisphaerae bacterium]|nr:hypothetical protein [Lentisphaerota bacterium]
MAQIDTIKGYALIQDVTPDGEIVWAGETRIDWDSQRPADNPAECTCLDCSYVCLLDEMKKGQNDG